jgi:hypothetical protein
MEAFTIAAAAIPAVIDLIKGGVNKWLQPDGFKATNIDEFERVSRTETEKFKALNEAGQGGQSYQWVEAIVRLQRPVVAAVTLATWSGLHIMGQGSPAVDNIAGAVFFYLFGDRTLGYVKAKP